MFTQKLEHADLIEDVPVNETGVPEFPAQVQHLGSRQTEVVLYVTTGQSR